MGIAAIHSPFRPFTFYPFPIPWTLESSYTDSLFSLFAPKTLINTQARLDWKHSLQSTGLPAEGLKGTLSFLPH